MDRPNKFIRVFDAISQLCNVLFLDGDANESMSGRSFRQSWWSEKLINYLVFWEKDHCRLAYYADLERSIQYYENHKNSKRT